MSESPTPSNTRMNLALLFVIVPLRETRHTRVGFSVPVLTLSGNRRARASGHEEPLPIYFSVLGVEGPFPGMSTVSSRRADRRRRLQSCADQGDDYQYWRQQLAHRVEGEIRLGIESSIG